MKIKPITHGFKPFSIEIETMQELICMRAIIECARNGESVEEVMRERWARRPDCGPPQPRDVEDFAATLQSKLLCDSPGSN